MTVKRFEPATRKRMLIEAAVEVARQPGGWSKLTRESIARQGECSDGLISRYLGDMASVRKVVMRVAVKRKIAEIIVQSLAAHDGYAIKKWLPADLRKRSISLLLG